MATTQYNKQHFTNLQAVLYENLFDILGFQTDTPKSLEKLKQDKENLIKYLESENPEIEDVTMIPAIIENVKKEKDKIERYPKIVYTMSFIYSIAHFEAFLADILKGLLHVFPISLSTSKKQMTYEEILKQRSGKKIIDSIIQKELIELSFKNISDQIEYFSTKFNISFKYVKGEATWGTEELDIEKLIELFSIRNIILHNNSIINTKFLKDNPGSSFTEGQKLVLTDKQVSDTIILLLAVGHKMAHRTISKVEAKNKK